MDPSAGELTHGATSGVPLIIVCLITLPATSASCIHDAIQPSTVTKTTVPYPAISSLFRQNAFNTELVDDADHNDISNRQSEADWDKSDVITNIDRHHHVNRRDVNSLESIMSPIRISVQFQDIHVELRSEEQELLRRVVTETVNKVSALFKVIPVEGNLVLQRSSACSVWISGPNRGKCAKIHNSYDGEKCLDEFQIPDAHLEGIYLWDASHPEPVRAGIEPGEGVPDTDYVLYVRAASLPSCWTVGQSVIAYATYCQTDQNSRPLAGYINFCASWIRSNSDNEDKLKLTTLHEIFHALGFSTKLFDQYRSCELSGSEVECTPHHNPVHDALGVHRLVMPKVVEVTSAHFGCVTGDLINQFGPILETKGDDWTSHWDGLFMYGSVMTPEMGLPAVTRVDVITLATFEDMGWYKVNYEYAEDLVWGKGGGCHFGLASMCTDDAEQICHLNENGCHHLHLHQATCETTSQSHGCLLFKPDPEGSCLIASNSDEEDAVGNSFQDDHRCFRTNVTSSGSTEVSELVGSCFPHRCLKNNTLEVQVGESAWHVCPYSSIIQVPGYEGIIECPPAGVLCQQQLPWIQLEPESSPESSEAAPEPEPEEQIPIVEPEREELGGINDIDDDGLICIEVIFHNADYRAIETAGRLSDFLGHVLEKVVEVTGISHKRLTVPEIFSGSVIVRFNVEPKDYITITSQEPSSKDVYDSLREYVLAGNLSVRLRLNATSVINFTATDVRQGINEPFTLSGGSPSPGIMAAIVIASLIIATLIGVLMLYVQRYYAATTRVIPHRELTESTPRTNHSTQPTADEILQWHAPAHPLDGHPVIEENGPNDSVEQHYEINLERLDLATSPDDVVINELNFEPATMV